MCSPIVFGAFGIVCVHYQRYGYGRTAAFRCRSQKGNERSWILNCDEHKNAEIWVGMHGVCNASDWVLRSPTGSIEGHLFMHAIMGITGQIGGVVARALLTSGQPVRAVVRDAAKGQAWSDRGCVVAL